MKRRERRYSGSLSPAVTERELKNREIARRTASEGFVLLKNEQILPFAETEKVFWPEMVLFIRSRAVQAPEMSMKEESLIF